MCVNRHRNPPMYCARGARGGPGPHGARGLVVVRHFSGLRVRGVRRPGPGAGAYRGASRFQRSTLYCELFLGRSRPHAAFGRPGAAGPAGAPLALLCALWGLPAGGRAGGPLYFALSGVWWRDFRAANPRPKVQRKNRACTTRRVKLLRLADRLAVWASHFVSPPWCLGRDPRRADQHQGRPRTWFGTTCRPAGRAYRFTTWPRAAKRPPSRGSRR